jgi:hypothetical protein
MVFEVTTSTTADRARAWATLIDLDDWPQWTDSITAIDRLDNGPLRVGRTSTRDGRRRAGAGARAGVSETSAVLGSLGP